jgi:hypothetical protein
MMRTSPLQRESKPAKSPVFVDLIDDSLSQIHDLFIVFFRRFFKAAA